MSYVSTYELLIGKMESTNNMAVCLAKAGQGKAGQPDQRTFCFLYAGPLCCCVHQAVGFSGLLVGYLWINHQETGDMMTHPNMAKSYDTYFAYLLLFFLCYIT